MKHEIQRDIFVCVTLVFVVVVGRILLMMFVSHEMIDCCPIIDKEGVQTRESYTFLNFWTGAITTSSC